MRRKKNKNIKNVIKNITLYLSLGVGISLLAKLLIPGMYSLFMSLLGISIKLLSGVVIGGSILGIIIVLGLVTKCIEIKTEYVYDRDIEHYPDLMREQLRVINSKDRNLVKEEPAKTNKFSYLYDNNYEDCDDIEIDDIMNPDCGREYNPGYIEFDEYDDSDVKIYSRKRK